MAQSTRCGIGVDISDRTCEVLVLDAAGQELESTKLKTEREVLRRYFGRLEPAQVAMEVGTHSPWISRLLEELGHEVYVANARKLRAIWDSDFKCDRTDARLLAEIVLFRPALLRPIKHRGDAARLSLAVTRTRAVLVQSRTRLINHVRGVVKALGGRIATGDADTFHKRSNELPEEVREVLEPVMKLLTETTAWIRGFDARIAKELEDDADAPALLQVPNVGPVTVSTFMNTVENPNRFPQTRRIASYLGLVPRRDQSGDQDRQLGITKAGDNYLRSLLVQCAQRTLTKRAADTDLKRWGLKLAERGGKNAKKRAIVAVARKLAILLLTLWRTKATYQPLRGAPIAPSGGDAQVPPAPLVAQRQRGPARRQGSRPVRAGALDPAPVPASSPDRAGLVEPGLKRPNRTKAQAA